MILPESERTVACLRGIELMADPKTEVLALGRHGVAIRDRRGNVLSVTRQFVSFEPARLNPDDLIWQIPQDPDMAGE